MARQVTTASKIEVLRRHEDAARRTGKRNMAGHLGAMRRALEFSRKMGDRCHNGCGAEKPLDGYGFRYPYCSDKCRDEHVAAHVARHAPTNETDR